jgi:hypothetical protein
MPVTQTISIVITSETPSDVEGYVRDCIDNADQDWEIESAEITQDGIITDLLEDEDPSTDTATEEGVEEAIEEEDSIQTTTEEGEPTGKEF